MSIEEATAFLGYGPRLMHLAVVDPAGDPLVHPVWFFFHEDRFYVHLAATSRKAMSIRHHPGVYFTIDEAAPVTKAPRGVRGPGRATIVEDRAFTRWVVEQHCLKYVASLEMPIARRLLGMAGQGILAIAVIEPDYLATWDFSRTPVVEEESVTPAVHDRGGMPAGPISTGTHPLANWERRTDALMRCLFSPGRRIIKVDEMRRAIESIEPARYEALGYYERWATALETLLIEKGILTAEEIDRQLESGSGASSA